MMLNVFWPGNRAAFLQYTLIIRDATDIRSNNPAFVLFPVPVYDRIPDLIGG
jgi:hypothetical protein